MAIITIISELQFSFEHRTKTIGFDVELNLEI